MNKENFFNYLSYLKSDPVTKAVRDSGKSVAAKEIIEAMKKAKEEVGMPRPTMPPPAGPRRIVKDSTKAKLTGKMPSSVFFDDMSYLEDDAKISDEFEKMSKFDELRERISVQTLELIQSLTDRGVNVNEVLNACLNQLIEHDSKNKSVVTINENEGAW